jgi:hypothetical protein
VRTTNRLLQILLIAVLSALFSVESQAQDAWGALVACCHGLGKGSSCATAVSTGFGSGPTQEAARASASGNAMSDTNQDAEWKCNAVRVFNRGCGYISEGCNEITNQCGWAIGVTQQEALMKLNHLGYAGGGEEHARGGGCIGR